jgi:hypothetical protein
MTLVIKYGILKKVKSAENIKKSKIAPIPPEIQYLKN